MNLYIFISHDYHLVEKICFCLFLSINKQANQKTNKQTSKQESKQTNKQLLQLALNPLLVNLFLPSWISFSKKQQQQPTTNKQTKEKKKGRLRPL